MGESLQLTRTVELTHSCCKLSPMKIPSSRLAVPGSLRIGIIAVVVSEIRSDREQARQRSCRQLYGIKGLLPHFLTKRNEVWLCNALNRSAQLIYAIPSVFFVI